MKVAAQMKSIENIPGQSLALKPQKSVSLVMEQIDAECEIFLKSVV